MGSAPPSGFLSSVSDIVIVCSAAVNRWVDVFDFCGGR